MLRHFQRLSSTRTPSDGRARSIMFLLSVPRDIRDFLDGYPRQSNHRSLSANLLFYKNKLRCQPNNLLIDELHEQWQGDYRMLEREHGYIQWLFPIPEQGVNHQAQPLQRHEMNVMKDDPAVIERVLRSYRLMLDFYGMSLQDSTTGLLERSENYAERYENLIRRTHNNLRMSRILKCLSILGLEHLNAGFLLFVLSEQSEHQKLDSDLLCYSMDGWWANCLRNQAEREWIRGVIESVRTSKGDESYKFTREMYTQALDSRKETGSLGNR